MSLKKLTKKATQQNVAVLEDLFLTSNIDMSWLDSGYYNQSQIVDVAIATLAQYGNTVLLRNVFEEEELNHELQHDYMMIRALTEIYALWVDKKAIIARPDNMLHEPDMTQPHWKTLFDFEMTKLIITKGKLMKISNRSVYGWEDYTADKKKLPKVVAVFNLKEDSWSEFAGSFATEHDSYTGFTCNVMYADGTFRDLRYEGDLGQIMRELS